MRVSFTVIVAAMVCAGIQQAMAEENAIHLGSLNLRPSVSASVTHDSNVNLADTDEESDTFAEYAAQVVGDVMGEQAQLRGSLWVAQRDYADFNDLDETSFGEYASVFLAAPGGTSLLLTENYRETLDFDTGALGGTVSSLEAQLIGTPIDRTTRGKKSLFDVAAGAEREMTDKLTGRALYSYSMVDYDDTDTEDWDENRIMLEGAQKVTEKTEVLLNGQYGMFSGDAAESDPTFWRALVGAQSSQTDKTRIRGLVGASVYSRDAGDETSLSAELGANWQASEKTAVTLTARNEVQPVVNDNFKDIYLASLGFSHSLTDTLTLSASGTYRQDDVQDPLLINGIVLEDVQSKQTIGEIRLAYQRNLLGLFASARYDDTTSDLGDYQEYRGTVGARLGY